MRHVVAAADSDARRRLRNKCACGIHDGCLTISSLRRKATIIRGAGGVFVICLLSLVVAVVSPVLYLLRAKCAAGKLTSRRTACEQPCSCADGDFGGLCKGPDAFNSSGAFRADSDE